MVITRRSRWDRTKEIPSKIGIMDMNGLLRELVFWKSEFSPWGVEAQNFVDNMPCHFEPSMTYFFHNLRPGQSNKPDASL
jgi:hypothetical protein